MNPVQSLQHMLNHLAGTYSAIPRLAETGAFDEPTLETVMIFQRDFGLPVTGVVDQTVWKTITEIYYDDLLHFWTPPLLHVLPNGRTVVKESEQASAVLVAQAILTELMKVLSNFDKVDFGGVNTGTTFRNLKRIQQLAAFEETGTLNRATWVILSALYRIYITRQAMRTFPL